MFEVVSPSNTRTDVSLKTGEYRQAGVQVVCVVDPQYEVVNVHYPELPTATLRGDDVLRFEEFPGFALPVSQLFA